MSFESEVLLGRFRARGTRLFLPTLLLGLAAFLLSFLYGRFTAQWQLISLYVGVGLLAFFGFAVPSLRYLTTWTDITNARLVHRSGLWGQHFRELSFADITAVELAAGVITVRSGDEEPLELRGLPKSKLISQELSNLAARGSGFSRGA